MVLARVLLEEREGPVEHRVLIAYSIFPVELTSR